MGSTLWFYLLGPCINWSYNWSGKRKWSMRERSYLSIPYVGLSRLGSSRSRAVAHSSYKSSLIAYNSVPMINIVILHPSNGLNYNFMNIIRVQCSFVEITFHVIWIVSIILYTDAVYFELVIFTKSSVFWKPNHFKTKINGVVPLKLSNAFSSLLPFSNHGINR